MKLEEQMAQMVRGTGLENTIKEMMFNESPKLDKLPRKLFHATATGNTSSILENGLTAHDVYGQVYFTDKQKNALKFVRKPCVVFEIDPTRLIAERLVVSTDHNRRVFNFDCFAYYNDVPTTAIKSWKVFS